MWWIMATICDQVWPNIIIFDKIYDQNSHSEYQKNPRAPCSVNKKEKIISISIEISRIDKQILLIAAFPAVT